MIGVGDTDDCDYCPAGEKGSSEVSTDAGASTYESIDSGWSGAVFAPDHRSTELSEVGKSTDSSYVGATTEIWGRAAPDQIEQRVTGKGQMKEKAADAVGHEKRLFPEKQTLVH